MQYSFEDYVLDDARAELRRGAEIVAVEARIFNLLTYLVRNRDRVVTHEDLRMAIWDGRIVSVSTLSSCMNSVRTAIGDNGEDQRLVRTLPRKGFRFVGSVVEEGEAVRPAALPIARPEEPRSAEAVKPSTVLEPAEGSSHALTVSPAMPGDGSTGLAERSFDPSASIVIPPARPVRNMAVFAAGGGVGALAATLLFIVWSHSGAQPNGPTPRPAKVFDASIVPLVADEVRRGLASYRTRPDFKAFALGPNGQWQVTDGAKDLDSAKDSALRGCADKAKRACTIYAAGMDVIWSSESVPLPAPGELRVQALETPLVIGQIPAVGPAVQHQITEVYPKGLAHKALAITTLGYGWVASLNTRGEAARVAVERCAYRYQRPCMILAVDDLLTIEIPKSRNIARIFLPSWELEMTDADRERVGRIYQGHEWRALARGTAGNWYPVADQPSEDAAIEAALKACRLAGEECRLHAIGNFIVADE